MEKITDKIENELILVLDSEIIQNIERAKEIPGFDINLGCNDDNWSLLMYAVDYDNEDLVRYLLSDPHINVNHRTYHGYTALYFCDQVSILKLLLNRKDLDVNIQNSDGETGLHQGCYWGRKACVREYLLDARGDALIRDNRGRPAKNVASGNGWHRIAKIINNSEYTILLRIPNNLLCRDIVRMIIEGYT